MFNDGPSDRQLFKNIKIIMKSVNLLQTAKKQIFWMPTA